MSIRSSDVPNAAASRAALAKKDGFFSGLRGVLARMGAAPASPGRSRASANRPSRMQARMTRIATHIDRFAEMRDAAQRRMDALRAQPVMTEADLRREHSEVGQLLSRLHALNANLAKFLDYLCLSRGQRRGWRGGEGSLRHALRGEIGRLADILADVRRMHVELSAQLIEYA